MIITVKLRLIQIFVNIKQGLKFDFLLNSLFLYFFICFSESTMVTTVFQEVLQLEKVFTIPIVVIQWLRHQQFHDPEVLQASVIIIPRLNLLGHHQRPRMGQKEAIKGQNPDQEAVNMHPCLLHKFNGNLNVEKWFR